MFKKTLVKCFLNLLVLWVRMITYLESRDIDKKLTNDQLIIKHGKFHNNGNISFDQDAIKRINKWRSM